VDAALLNSLLRPVLAATAAATGESTVSMVYGLGRPGSSWGAWSTLNGLQTTLATTLDLGLITAVGQGLIDVSPVTDGVRWSAGAFGQFLGALDRYVAGLGLAGVRGLDDLLVYYNAGNDGVEWQCLADPLWRDLFSAWRGGLFPSVGAVGAWSDNLGTKTFAGSFVAGDVIDAAKYAGGLPKLASTGVTGTGTVTVTGTARTPETLVVTPGVTWTAAVTTSGTVNLVPGTAPANSLILSSTGLSHTGLTGGTFVVKAETAMARVA